MDAGGGVWGDHDRSYAFDIGPTALVSTVDITAHTMTVRQDGEVLRVIPVTTGKDGYLTRGGIKVIIAKERTRLMDSRTVDIPPGSPDAYHLLVSYAMRLTWSGEFVHAAPWSVAHQGHENVSHGCTGMSDANAAWFYGISQVGDVVRYVHSTRDLEPATATPTGTSAGPTGRRAARCADQPAGQSWRVVCVSLSPAAVSSRA